MKLSLHTVICCCVFTTILPPVRGTTTEPNATLRKRFRVWLQSHVRRDLPNSSVATNEQTSNIPDGPSQDAEALSSPSSFGLNERRKRSSKQSRCVLVTCLYHEMVYKLHEMSKPKASIAPQQKISSSGYGRRRRSLADTIQLTLQTGKERGSSDAASKVSLAAEKTVPVDL